MNREMLELYSDYLLSSFGYTTATGLSALTSGAVSHDQVTRFLASEDFGAKALWQLVKPLVREIEKADGVLIVDDTVEEKPYTETIVRDLSSESELVCWHYDHSQGRSVKGINIVNVLYEADGMRIPVGFETVEKSLRVWDEKKSRWQKKSAANKNEQVRAMLKLCKCNAIKFNYVLADAWYAAEGSFTRSESSAETMELIHEELKKRFVMPVKSNRKVALSLEDKEQGNYQAVSLLALEANTTTEVWVEQLTFPMLLAKQVFINEEGKA